MSEVPWATPATYLEGSMRRDRMEAFSDGVLAIIITIMVLELKLPRAPTWQALAADLPVFLSYVLSFIYVGIYWNNHHHMLQSVERVNGKVLWANLFFLFWLSLFPFATAWMGENHFTPLPTAMYGVVLLIAAVSWIPLARTLICSNGGADGVLGRALGGRGGDWKVKASLLVYALAIPLAFYLPVLSCALYALVALLWIVPDRRIELHLKHSA